MKQDDIAKIEKLIESKYGKDATRKPSHFITIEKQCEIDEQYKSFREKIASAKDTYAEIDQEKRFLERVCPMCSTLSFKHSDDFYMIKFECCERCYIKHYEGREHKYNTMLKQGLENG